ncbi:MAG: DUF3592 domain-containing protein [Treponema sp.]|nr:DUF3592 domain-containing protein [Treponema sp.]
MNVFFYRTYSPKAYGIFFSLFGGCWFIAGLAITLYTCIFVSHAVETRGTVIENKLVSTGKNTSVYYPVFAYTDENGTQYTIQSNMGNKPPRYKTGQEISILYAKNKPGSAKINSFVELYLPGTLFGGIGFILLALGITITVIFWHDKIKLTPIWGKRS